MSTVSTESLSKYSRVVVKFLALLSCAVFIFDSYNAGTFTSFLSLFFWLHLGFVALFVIKLIWTNAPHLVALGMSVLTALMFFAVLATLGMDSLITLYWMGFFVILSLRILVSSLVDEVGEESHPARQVLALLFVLALVCSFNLSVAKLVKVPYSFDATNIACEDVLAGQFLADFIASRQFIVRGVAVLTRPTSESDVPGVGELGIIHNDTLSFSSELCDDGYCINQIRTGLSNGDAYIVTLKYSISRQGLTIETLQARVALQNADWTGVCGTILTPGKM